MRTPVTTFNLFVIDNTRANDLNPGGVGLIYRIEECTVIPFAGRAQAAQIQDGFGTNAVFGRIDDVGYPQGDVMFVLSNENSQTSIRTVNIPSGEVKTLFLPYSEFMQQRNPRLSCQ